MSFIESDKNIHDNTTMTKRRANEQQHEIKWSYINIYLVCNNIDIVGCDSKIEREESKTKP